jgi:uncharacterized C2H2 Zn-finger protein
MGRHWNICPRCGAMAKLAANGRMHCHKGCGHDWASRSVIVAGIKRKQAAKAAEGGAE